MSDDPTDAWLSRDPLPSDPLERLVSWLDEAFAAGLQPNPHAIALATSDADGAPSVRMVLCKHIDAEGGTLRFYTDRESRKGHELAARPRAAAVFYFSGQDRQARVEGRVMRCGDGESDTDFAARPEAARLAITASDQSQPVASRGALLAGVERVRARESGAGDADLPRPETWGGFDLQIENVELWVSRPDRIHDRARWRRGEGGGWQATRLQP